MQTLPAKIPVVLCDTQPVTIEGVRSVLSSCPGLELAGAATSLPELDTLTWDSRPVILLDKAFGLTAILSWMERRQAGPDTARVVIWGGAFTDVEALRLLQAGMDGILKKTASACELERCLQAVAAGERWMDETVVRRARNVRNESRSWLTSREREVMELAERGMRNREIADQLGIQTGTVKIHMKHIFEKVGVRGRFGLALSAMQRALPPAAEETGSRSS